MMAFSDSPSESSARRRFFREALGRAIEPVANYLERHRFGVTDPTPLRPPGAVTESLFVDRCQRCGACVEACPADAIFPLAAGTGRAAGTPAIDPDLAACVVCEGLQCTQVCPSGALQRLVEPAEIRMGTAEVYSSVCVRSDGEACSLCVERCPLGEAAIEFDGGGPPTVRSPGCVGCGVCQLYCPTEPKAIVVRPHTPS